MDRDGLVGGEDAQFLLGKIHRQVGNLSQAQKTLEALLRMCESKGPYGRDHIRKLCKHCGIVVMFM